MNNTTSFTKMHNEMIKLRERAENAEKELAEVQAILAKLRPVAYLDYWKSDGTGIVHKQRTTGMPFFSHPHPPHADNKGGGCVE
jgi:hypothetical protein